MNQLKSSSVILVFPFLKVTAFSLIGFLYWHVSYTLILKFKNISIIAVSHHFWKFIKIMFYVDKVWKSFRKIQEKRTCPMEKN